MSAIAIGLIMASAIVSVETDSWRFFERYLIILQPLLAVAFLCWLEDRRRGHRIAAGIGIAVIALAALFPLSSYAEGQGRADSPTLQTVYLFSESVGIGSASLIAALAVTGAVCLVVLASFWQRVPRAVLIGTALVCLATVSVGGHIAEAAGSQRLEEASFANDADWVDATGARDVTLVQTAYSGNIPAMVTSFWNTSVTSISSLENRNIDPVEGQGKAMRMRDDGFLMTETELPCGSPFSSLRAVPPWRSPTRSR